jgi:hypothetical protein
VLDKLSAVAAKLNAAQARRQHEPPRADPELDQFMVRRCIFFSMDQARCTMPCVMPYCHVMLAVR